MKTFIKILNYTDYASTIIVVISVVVAVVLWAKGILPGIAPLGNGLARKKLRFCQSRKSDELKSTTHSDLFSENNILEITKKEISVPPSVQLYIWCYGTTGRRIFPVFYNREKRS